VAIYRVPFSLAAGASAAAGLVLANLKAAASDRVALRAANLFVEVAPTTAPIIGLIRMNGVGAGAITSSVPEKSDPADGTASSVLETAWATTRPTTTGLLLARAQLPVTLAAAVLLDLTSRPIIIPVSGGLCITLVNAGGATGLTLGGWLELEE
jgi:hypothetical protein